MAEAPALADSPLPPRAPRIADPQAVAVVGVDDHLPPVSAQRLNAQALRQHFQAAAPWQPELPGDNPLRDAQGTTAAAVLIALVMREHGLQVLLTQRTAHLRDHAGQISFPGGRSEPEDADAVATALRETEEEVGLARHHVEVIGRLPDYITITGYSVTPVVALVQPNFQLSLDAFEVAEAFEVPLAFLMTPAHHRRHAAEFEGQMRRFLSMPWVPAASAAALADPPREYFIWGATAAMLRNLYRFLAA